MIFSTATLSDPSVSVAIINYNGSHQLAHTLRAVARYCVEACEVLLIDNQSNDDSVAFVRQHFPWVSIHQMRDNFGPGYARNRALELAQCDRVLLLDNDVQPTEGCLTLLIDRLASRHSASVVMPAVVYKDDPTSVQFAGADSHCLGTVKPRFNRVKLAKLPSGVPDCTSLISAALLVDRRRIGSDALFNEELFIYQEDHEAGMRLVILGHDVLIEPRAHCLHGDGTIGLSVRDTGQVKPLRVELNLRNRWYVLATLFEWRSLLYYLPALIIYEVFCLFSVLKQGNLKIWLRTFLSLWEDRSVILQRRRWVQSARVRRDNQVLVGGRFPFNPEISVSTVELLARYTLHTAVYVNDGLVRLFTRYAAK